jgi:hypothetical protein
VRAERAVECRVDDAGLHVDLEIFRPHRHHLRHARQVEHDAAAHRDRVSLEARAGAARRDRDALRAGEAEDGLHLVGRERPDDGLGEHAGQRRRVPARRRQVGGADGDALAEALGERLQRARG